MPYVEKWAVSGFRTDGQLCWHSIEAKCPKLSIKLAGDNEVDGNQDAI